MPFSVHRITGLVYGQDRQDVAFLECTEDAEINAKGAFDDLNEKHQLEMRNKFDYWKRGNHNDSYFHGFKEIGYRECFVFKRKQAGTYYRFYGFLIHPRVLSDAGYRLCILVSYAKKNQANTDPNELNFVNGIRVRVDVITAVKKEFPEKPGGSNATLHRKQR
jgi:hypothetical protein